MLRESCSNSTRNCQIVKSIKLLHIEMSRLENISRFAIIFKSIVGACLIDAMINQNHTKLSILSSLQRQDEIEKNWIYLQRIDDPIEISKLMIENIESEKHLVFLYQQFYIQCNMIAKTENTLSFINIARFIWRNYYQNLPIMKLFSKKFKKVSSSPTSDGKERQFWMKNFIYLNSNVSYETNGRIRVMGDQLRFRSIQDQDKGLYTCAQIDSRTGIRFEHHYLATRPFNDNWFDLDNSIAIFKTTMISVLILIIIPAIIHQYFTFDSRNFQEQMRAI
ncbi:hypothetical protein SSS_04421 [Sarcoptes scabiei]|uniref:Ig-like domain-containing protein n=1 Tax=Sarcoptes scabiei TaxID=52283 RepID=A0A834VHC1_SARSC|nr:hypothetical protein SSS_04421 [Sarcoptes scabiei]